MSITFDRLVQNVEKVHDVTTSTAKAAVNQMLTIRNWAIGYYIVEFEQNGKDRSEYGSHLLENLSQRLNIKGLGRLQLNLCRIFYQKYPQICSTASNKFQTDPEMLISRLSFSHIREIMVIDDPFERFFYEFECMRGTWSVKELRRQISTNLYFRAGVSKKPELLLEKIEQSDLATVMTVKEPFALEFLGLNANMAIDENDLENALMDHLQEFLLELGKGFCFEARQKRILIDDEYFFIDLVFYNRILHCNVIIELKDEKFTHENFGQLNSYVAYYKENEMNPGDNPPVGILLCTQKGPKMVEYALSGMDNQLFVSTYMLQLPDKDQLKEFLIEQMEEMGK